MALANDGRVFVADGYCNSRVAEFGANGTFRGAFLLPAERAAMRVPHSVVLQACPCSGSYTHLPSHLYLQELLAGRLTHNRTDHCACILRRRTHCM